MKSFFIIIGLLGGILSGSQLATSNWDNNAENEPIKRTYKDIEIKRVYVPSLNCDTDGEKIDIEMLDYHAKQCFDVGPEHIKMTFPSIQRQMDEDIFLTPGDILVHYDINEIGLLLNRFDVLKDDNWPLWAWDILWVGRDAQDHGRYQAFTEEGLMGLIISGVFVHYKST